MEVDLTDVVFLSVSLKLKKEASYFSNPTITIHTNPNILSLFIHRHYFIYVMLMSTLFSLIVSLVLIAKDIYEYHDTSDLI